MTNSIIGLATVALLLLPSTAFADEKLEREAQGLAAHVMKALGLKGTPKTSTITRWRPSEWTPQGTVKKVPVAVWGAAFGVDDQLYVVRARFLSETNALDWAGHHKAINEGRPTLIEVRGNQAVLIQRAKDTQVGKLTARIGGKQASIPVKARSVDEVKALAAAWSYAFEGKAHTGQTLLMAAAQDEQNMSARVFVPRGELYTSIQRGLASARETRELEQRTGKPRSPGITYRWKGDDRVRIDFHGSKQSTIVRADERGAFMLLKPFDPQKETKSPEYARLKKAMQAREAEQKAAKAVAKKQATTQEALEGAAGKLNLKVGE